MNKDEKAELIGQLIDIFEDSLQERTVGNFSDNEGHSDWKMVTIFREDEDSNGVYFGGNFYDKVAVKIEETLQNWGLLNAVRD